MKNCLKKLLDRGDVIVGAQLRFGSPAIAELFGHAGFDFVVFDAEHAPQSATGIQQQIQAAAGTATTPVVRVPVNDPDLMRVYLDMGASTILAPFVNTEEQARNGAEAMRYPPVGTRGYGPSRAARYGLDPDYYENANQNMVYLPIIEDVEAVANIDAILAVEGVDSIVVGPADLSISMGVPMNFGHTDFKKAIRKIADAAERAGKPAGTTVYDGDLHETATYKHFVDQGFRLLLIGGDEWMLASSSKRVIDCVEEIKR